MWKFLRWLRNAYFILWGVVIVAAIMIGATADQETGINVLTMGTQVLFVWPIALVGHVAIVGLSQSGDANEAAFQLGGILFLIALVYILYQAFKDRKKKKKKPPPKKWVQVDDDAH